MGVVRVRAPDGREWAIRRRLSLRRPPWREFPGPNPEHPPLVVAGLDGLIGIVAIAAIVVAVVVTVFLVPLVVFVGEAVIAAVVAAAIGGTWTVEAATVDGREVKRWTVRGWRRSRRGAIEVARELEQGVPAAPTEVESA